MAFATNTLVNGEWTTTTMDVNAVLRHYQQQDRQASTNTVAAQKPPVLGLLSQTVIRSPLAHWILPVRLRNRHSNDVAFIGVGGPSPVSPVCDMAVILLSSLPVLPACTYSSNPVG